MMGETNPSSKEVALEPCPFCGGNASYDERVGMHYVRCETCAKIGDIDVSVLTASKDKTYELWNTRISADSAGAMADQPIDMILFCPRCGTQHVDVEEDETSFRHRIEAFSLVAEPQDRFPSRWTNPPHRSHLCHQCSAVWRPADVPTNGVARITTRGSEDNTWTNSVASPAVPGDEAAGWLPIETAPKDGSAVLLVWHWNSGIHQGVDVVRARWNCRKHSYLSRWKDCPNEPDCDMGWDAYSGLMSHWMPLPAPPVTNP